uniref:Uncharacterized protein n=1 Tax=Arundo donax TaxID=35708 RepID=A0A0A9AJT2_ARUDO
MMKMAVGLATHVTRLHASVQGSEPDGISAVLDWLASSERIRIDQCDLY